MPVYVLELKIPANTAATAPKRDTLEFPQGTEVEKIVLHVPAGHEGLQPVWFELNGTKVVPSNDAAFRLDDVPDLELPVDLRMDRTGRLELVGYNEDTVNEHTTRALVFTKR